MSVYSEQVANWWDNLGSAGSIMWMTPTHNPKEEEEEAAIGATNKIIPGGGQDLPFSS